MYSQLSSIAEGRLLITSILCQVEYNDHVKEDEMGRACSTKGEKRNAYMLLVGKSEWKRPLGRQ
jgi:hypothetical protein